MSLLARDPDRRPQSAEEVAQRIEDYLEGSKEKQRRLEEAWRLCALAEEPARRHVHLEAERGRLEARAREMLGGHQGLGAGGREAPRLGARRPRREGRTRRRAGPRARRRALHGRPRLRPAARGSPPRPGGALLGRGRAAWTSSAGRRRRSTTRRSSPSTTSTASTPPSIRAVLASLPADRTRRARTSSRGATSSAIACSCPGDELYLGMTPVDGARLEPGSWLVTIKAAGFRDVRYPVLLARGAPPSRRT